MKSAMSSGTAHSFQKDKITTPEKIQKICMWVLKSPHYKAQPTKIQHFTYMYSYIQLSAEILFGGRLGKVYKEPISKI